MAGPEPITPLNEGTSNQNSKSIIEGHVSALKELLKEPGNQNLIKTMLLDFDDIQDVGDDEVQDDVKGKTKVDDEDLSKVFKEILKCPFTRRIVEFSSPSHRMPANVKIYDGTGDPEDHLIRFIWDAQGMRQRPDGNFKNSSKGQRDPAPFQRELAKRFSDSIPKTMDEMLKRVDDYLRSEEAFRSTELPREGSNEETHRYSSARPLERSLGSRGEVEGYLVRRIHLDEGASVKIMFEHCFSMLHPSIRSRLVKTQTTVSGFSRVQVKPLGKIKLDVCFGGSGICRRAIMKFTFIPVLSPYNIILGRPGLKQLRAVPFNIHRTMKFPTPWGVAAVVSQTPVVLECRNERKKQVAEPSKMRGPLTGRVSTTQKFVEKKHRHFRMGTVGYDRKIDSKIEAVMGFPLKCFLDAYKGYHQVHIADEDEEKTSFYTDHGTYCYTKMLFNLKNAGATYQRLVDEAFQSQIRKNLEVYVDYMVVKSNTERGMLADIAKTFDNLRRINMKLNPKKCSFGDTEGKISGYMVISEGIRANPTKTKDIAEMQSDCFSLKGYI
uniref:Reverse transcriptase domain-containing protein n=1 Tax=Tanacetum cinerariifolium TaxID=118510 RepID=A0A6L2LNG2_TANCI|nr:reverse transcriptase domain-containing protein [Tanacetum cinerariifolium]